MDPTGVSTDTTVTGNVSDDNFDCLTQQSVEIVSMFVINMRLIRRDISAYED